MSDFVTLSLASFPDVKTMALIAQNEAVKIEVNDTYIKQTFRNRYRITSTTGATDLSIPVHSSQGNRAYSSVEIDYKNHWNRTHWRTLTAAYNNSPYFEYYCDAYEELLKSQVESLLEFNLKALQILCTDLGMKMPDVTSTWENPSEIIGTDFRDWINPNVEEAFLYEHYTQVFSDRFGFISGCSVLDLLFCLGPDAKFYLHNLQVPGNR
jgi:hypothetical protein